MCMVKGMPHVVCCPYTEHVLSVHPITWSVAPSHLRGVAPKQLATLSWPIPFLFYLLVINITQAEVFSCCWIYNCAILYFYLLRFHCTGSPSFPCDIIDTIFFINPKRKHRGVGKIAYQQWAHVAVQQKSHEKSSNSFNLSAIITSCLWLYNAPGNISPTLYSS